MEISGGPTSRVNIDALTRHVGSFSSNQANLTGRPVSGEEALRMGLANRLVEPDQALSASIELAQ